MTVQNNSEKCSRVHTWVNIQKSQLTGFDHYSYVLATKLRR